MEQPDPSALLDALDPDQRAVATQVTGPLAVLAGAGTGKTRAITYRIAYGVASGVYDPSQVLAVTFTKRAAYEMRHRLAQLGVPRVQARTFHSAALRQLIHFWPTVVGGPLPEILPHKASLVAASTRRMGLGSDKTLVRDLAAEIEWAKVSMIDSAHYRQRVLRDGHEVPAGLSASDMAQLLDVYEDAKAERGCIDFEDVLVHMCGILQERPEVAAIVRKQYQHFVVDEFQDVNALQQKLLDLWLGNRHDVCVVGDVAQTIYSFTGASPKYLLGFARKHPGARTVELVRDYRSTPQVVAVANRLMSLSGRSAGTVRLESQRPSGPAVSFRSYADDRAEAEGIADRVGQLIAQGTDAHRIAVLMRMNSQSQIIEEVFGQRGIPVAMTHATPFFNRESVRLGINALVVASRGQSMQEEHAGSARQSPGTGVGGQAPASAGDIAATTNETESPHDGLVDLVKDILGPVGWSPQAPAGTALRERWANLQAIVQWAQDSAATTLGDFVAELRERAQYQVEPDKNGVELTTIHAAKGLEWDAVFLIGASEGQLPISHATTDDEREEERRLAYVAITRARDILEVSWARARSTSGRGARKRSRLFDGIWPEEPAQQRATPRHVRTSSRAASRQRAAEWEESASEQTRDLFLRLKEWRLEVSKEMSKPPFSVFTDQTLRDIATVQPKTLRQLRVIGGVGDIKLERHGAHVLAIVRGDNWRDY
ncbi:ATP-dependent DNA helicase UvrD2 [Schaalia sp. ZJ405]|uniref:ATP-dependent DNA helicase UvrD2 n=1 Tax=Schaalia sp. ZJ405 TaxID=2709403 RepID=UPI0013EBC4AC|nr:ATP-dependent DNA helicase UvrD2 [Schaalia sp. ZJ405]QPK80753.1 ATP-dependent DNA helicase UvrD2 [Schaalia sp. ZJ405]